MLLDLLRAVEPPSSRIERGTLLQLRRYALLLLLHIHTLPAAFVQLLPGQVSLVLHALL